MSSWQGYRQNSDMSYDEISKYCNFCGKQVLARSPRPNHILHLLLTIITGGLWCLVWLHYSVKNKEWHCSFCGRHISLDSAPKPTTS